jgi:CelD/BcsL family acetyltransferase involved in cellulose biosynthesis
VIGADAFVETTTVEGLARLEPEWRDLASRAAEPNVFAGSEFLLPALRLAGAGRLTVLLVWPDASRARLIGVVALRLPPLGQGLARVWRSEQAGLAAAMFDADRIAAALEAALAWLRERRGVAGLIWAAVEPGGAVANAVHALAVRAALPLEEINPRRRAALVLGGETGFEAALEKKRRKEWARQQRRLTERGRLQTRLAEGADGIERFLALEAKGWKGARGTALAADPRRLGFARAMLGAFAERGRLQIHELALDDSAIAIGVVLRDGARAFYWKTAYDEEFGEFSPGVQLTLALSRRLEREPGLALVDSCALQDHPMIDRIWPGRIDLVDLALAVGAERGGRLRAWLAAERAASGLRERVKRLANRLRGRKRS